jgi:2-methylisocitrate lyase-like PEP mutase family enzyme
MTGQTQKGGQFSSSDVEPGIVVLPDGQRVSRDRMLECVAQIVAARTRPTLPKPSSALSVPDLERLGVKRVSIGGSLAVAVKPSATPR